MEPVNNQHNFPVGISDFKKIRENDYYYIDKSGLIKELLKRESAEVTLITRPRRFGKTMGMSMLAHFLIYGPITGGYSMVLKLSTIQVGQSLHTMSTALKDNTALRFAVITGCLKIAKESIFTGTNNFVSDNITDSRFNEYFGFTQEEVDQILTDANVSGKAEEVKRWYDGYHFGRFDVYCPWDVMNYMRDLQQNPEAAPASRKRNKNKKMQVTVSYITVTCIFLFIA